jgi:hypothetical protein
MALTLDARRSRRVTCYCRPVLPFAALLVRFPELSNELPRSRYTCTMAGKAVPVMASDLDALADAMCADAIRSRAWADRAAGGLHAPVAWPCCRDRVMT